MSVAHSRIALLAFLAVAACSVNEPPGAPTDLQRMAAADTVSARLENERVVVTNTLDVAVRFSLLERRWFETALALWRMGGPECGTLLRPGATQSIALAEIAGYGPQATEVLLFWWRPVPEDQTSGVRQEVVKLR